MASVMNNCFTSVFHATIDGDNINPNDINANVEHRSVPIVDSQDAMTGHTDDSNGRV